MTNDGKDESKTEEILQKLVEKDDEGSKQSSSLKYIPHDQYSHKNILITNAETRDVENYEDFLSKELAIANIQSDEILQLNSAHIRNVQLQLLDMFKSADQKITREIIKNLFNHFHVSYIAELKTTRSKDGMERELQAEKQREQHGSGYTIPEPVHEEAGSEEIQLYD